MVNSEISCSLWRASKISHLKFYVEAFRKFIERVQNDFRLWIYFFCIFHNVYKSKLYHLVQLLVKLWSSVTTLVLIQVRARSAEMTWAWPFLGTSARLPHSSLTPGPGQPINLAGFDCISAKFWFWIAEINVSLSRIKLYCNQGMASSV